MDKGFRVRGGNPPEAGEIPPRLWERGGGKGKQMWGLIGSNGVLKE